MRAVEPSWSGSITIAGYPVHFDAYGDPDHPALLLMPAWQIIDRRFWKMQVAGFFRTHYVITFDGARLPGEVPDGDAGAFEYDRIAEQAVGLLDHLGITRASVAGLARGGSYAMLMAARYPERVDAMVLISNGVEPDNWGSPPAGFRDKRESYSGWEKYNEHYWREDWDGWLDFFFDEVFSEPFSSKAIDDAKAWARETNADILARTEDDPSLMPRMPVEDAIAAITCPVLMIHGDDARCTPIYCSLQLSSLRADWPLVVLEGAGQIPQLRDPVRVNMLVADFLRRACVVTPGRKAQLTV